MKKPLAALLLLLCAAATWSDPSPVRHAVPLVVGQTPPTKAPVTKAAAEAVLEIKGGGVKTIEVERQIIIKVPVEVVTSFPFTVEGNPDLGLYFWSAPGAAVIDLGNVLEITAAPKGDLTVSAKIIDKIDGKWVTKFGRKTVSIGAPSPLPPPDPGPKPPPDPKPGPDGTSPFAEAGFRVMIAFTPNVLMLPGDPRRDIIHGKPIRDYMDAKCVMGPPGEKDERGQQMRDWRIWPANTDARFARPVLRDAWAKKGEGDWILIGDGKTGCSVALPKTEAEALTLLKKYGGE